MFKALAGSEFCLEKMTKVYNELLEVGMVGRKWKVSKSCMIPKTKKPSAKEHRPIALTTVGYKLFMSMLKDRMVEQELNDPRIKSLQSGFMKGRRLEDQSAEHKILRTISNFPLYLHVFYCE